MADIFKWTNDAKTTLDGAHNNTTLTINVATGDGALFPSPVAGEAFAITIKKTDGTAEICYCTSRTSDALTVTRGQETSLGAAVAQTYVGGETIGLRVTAGSLVELIQNSLLSATGDIMYASAANTPAKRTIGATNEIATVAGGVPVWDDGTAMIGAIAASQAEQEAGSITNKPVSPGRQQYHPSAAKAWIKFDGTGTPGIDSDYNVTSITDNDVGDYTINFTTNMSDTNYAPIASAGGGANIANVDTYAVGSFRFRTFTDAAVATDVADNVCVVFGDQ